MINIKNISNDDLLKKYAAGKLPLEQEHAIEEAMLDSNFLNDAVEGLQQINNQEKIEKYVTELNVQLQQQTKKVKKRRLKKVIKNLDAIELTVIIVVVLCLLGYFVIRLYSK
jgi:hypothetical protein